MQSEQFKEAAFNPDEQYISDILSFDQWMTSFKLWKKRVHKCVWCWKNVLFNVNRKALVC